MNIRVWGINYAPEVVGIAPYNTALCEHFARSGHQVNMVTSFCYYPAWKKLPADRRQLFRTDHSNGVQVHRCWHYVPKKVSALRRIAHELTFVFTSFLRQLFLPRPDLLLVVSPPLLLGFAAWMLTLLKRCPFVFHVQDLQPEAAAGLGMLKSPVLLAILKKVELFAYKKAARVSAITPGMLRNIAAKNVPAAKLIYFPNGAAFPQSISAAPRGRFRTARGFAEDDFLVVYSGNIGVKQGLEVLLATAACTRDPRIRFVICGDGAHAAPLKSRAAALNLKNVLFLPLLSEAHYDELLLDANLCVVPQQPGTGGYSFPSKIMRILAARRPVLAITDLQSELAEAVKTGGFGQVISPLDPAAVASEIAALSRSPELLAEYGRAGYKFAKRFDQSAILEEFTTQIEQLLPALSPRPAIRHSLPAQTGAFPGTSASSFVSTR